MGSNLKNPLSSQRRKGDEMQGDGEGEGSRAQLAPAKRKKHFGAG